ncbi:MAG TPA: hypothetical protein VHL58_06105 [Thermoanaerobaculia bacterium]|nr:hypothetical protein [Thermoanaerobaculia bacterium]
MTATASPRGAAALREQQAEATKLDQAIRENVAQLGYREGKEDAP